MATETLDLAYAGPGLESHSIDAREHGPALIAISDLFVTAHIELGREGPVPAVRVIATSEGSFIVQLIVSTPSGIESYLEPVSDWLNTSGPAATATGLGIVAPVLGALAWMIARVRKGREQHLDSLAPGEIEVQWEDGTTVRTVSEAAALVDSMDMRRALRKVASPLDRRGEIDQLTLRAPGSGQPEVTIEPSDLHALEVPLGDDSLLTDSEREVVLRLKKVAFSPDGKWQVTDGASTFWASMNDLNFALEVADSVASFSANDQLRCILRERQFATADGDIRVEHSIVRVLEHRRAAQQPHLPLGE